MTPLTGIVATLAAILDRPIAAERMRGGYDVCACAHCEAERAVPLTCAACGFAGAPWVYPCTCDNEEVTCAPPNVQCAHLCRTCPVCGVSEDGDPREAFELIGGRDGVAGMVRDLRATLAGLA